MLNIYVAMMPRLYKFSYLDNRAMFNIAPLKPQYYYPQEIKHGLKCIIKNKYIIENIPTRQRFIKIILP